VNLKELDLEENAMLVTLPAVHGLSELEKLKLVRFPLIESAVSLPAHLKKLHLEDNTKLDTLLAWSDLPYLEKLYLIGLPLLESVGALPAYLKELAFDDNAKLDTLPALKGLSNLQKLNVTRLPLLKALGALPANLRKLIITGNDALASITELGSLTRLYKLWLDTTYCVLGASGASVTYSSSDGSTFELRTCPPPPSPSSPSASQPQQRQPTSGSPAPVPSPAIRNEPRIEVSAKVTVGGTVDEWSPESGRRAMFEKARADVLGAPCIVESVKAGSVVIAFVVVQYATSYKDSTSVAVKLGDPATLTAFAAQVASATGQTVESNPSVTKASAFTADGGVSGANTLSAGQICSSRVRSVPHAV
jgi:hypothetical protein